MFLVAARIHYLPLSVKSGPVAQTNLVRNSLFSMINLSTTNQKAPKLVLHGTFSVPLFVVRLYFRAL